MLKRLWCIQALLFTQLSFASIEQVTENITLKINPINEIELFENDSNLSISYQDAVAGDDPMQSSVLSSNTYSYTTVGSPISGLFSGLISKKIEAKLSQDLPEGKVLLIKMQAPDGASSKPFSRLLSTEYKTLVDHIPANTKAENLVISFILRSKTSSGPLEPLPVEISIKLSDSISHP